MTAAAMTSEAHPGIALRVLVAYLLALAIVIGTVLTIRALGSTTAGSPAPLPQTGPPVTLVVPVTGHIVRQ